MAKEGTRNLIIDTAATLFYQKGYSQVGINEIIAEAGIAKATLYNHSKSKEDLCIAYLDKKDNDLIVALRNFLNAKKLGKKRIVSILEFLLLFFKSEDFKGCWCIRTNAEMFHNIRIKDQIKSNKAQLLQLIEEEVDVNLEQLSKSKKKQLATTTYLLYEGAVMESFMQEDSWPIDHSILLLKNILKEI